MNINQNSLLPHAIRSGKSDPVQFKRGFKTGSFLFAKLGILQTTFLLWGIGLLRDKFATKMGSFGSEKSLFETLFKLDRVSFSTPDAMNLSQIGHFGSTMRPSAIPVALLCRALEVREGLLLARVGGKAAIVRRTESSRGMGIAAFFGLS